MQEFIPFAILFLGLLLDEECVAHHLHIHRTQHQADETQRDTSDDELAAPNRCLAGQQWVGGILNAATAQGCSFCTAAAALSSGTLPGVAYWVIAGDMVRILSCSWASFSTRSGVACAPLSISSRSYSFSKRCA